MSRRDALLRRLVAVCRRLVRRVKALEGAQKKVCDPEEEQRRREATERAWQEEEGRRLLYEQQQRQEASEREQRRQARLAEEQALLKGGVCPPFKESPPLFHGLADKLVWVETQPLTNDAAHPDLAALPLRIAEELVEAHNAHPNVVLRCLEHWGSLCQPPRTREDMLAQVGPLLERLRQVLAEDEAMRQRLEAEQRKCEASAEPGGQGRRGGRAAAKRATGKQVAGMGQGLPSRVLSVLRTLGASSEQGVLRKIVQNDLNANGKRLGKVLAHLAEGGRVRIERVATKRGTAEMVYLTDPGPQPGATSGG